MRVLGILFRGGIGGLFVWMRWIAPYQIQVQEHLLDVGFAQNIILIADLHLGVYKGKAYLERVVKLINQQQGIDAVLIAGDLTYHPVDASKEGLASLFAPLADSTVPVFAVLGNHDVEHPGPHLRDQLVYGLNQNGVTFLHNDVYDLMGTSLVGLGPHLSSEDKVSILQQFTSDDDVLVLTHNPDTTLRYTTTSADLTLVGHTHCGQIRFPYIQDSLRPYIYPVKGDFDCGWYEDQDLFITSGLGEVMLPLRFLNPPTIDVLKLR